MKNGMYPLAGAGYCKPSQFDTFVHLTLTTDLLFFSPSSSELTVVFPFSHITAVWPTDLEEKAGFLFKQRIPYYVTAKEKWTYIC